MQVAKPSCDQMANLKPRRYGGWYYRVSSLVFIVWSDHWMSLLSRAWAGCSYNPCCLKAFALFPPSLATTWFPINISQKLTYYPKAGFCAGQVPFWLSPLLLVFMEDGFSEAPEVFCSSLRIDVEALQHGVMTRRQECLRMGNVSLRMGNVFLSLLMMLNRQKFDSSSKVAIFDSNFAVSWWQLAESVWWLSWRLLKSMTSVRP